MSYPVPQVAPKSVRSLSVALQVLLATQVVACVLAIVATLNSRSVITQLQDDPDSVTDADLDGADSLTSLTGVLQAVLYLATAVVWIVWLYRARQNVDAWDADGQRLGAGWAIGGWFIPLVNLVLPVLVTKDVGTGTEYNRDVMWQRRGYPLAIVWGVAFALMNILTSIGYAKNRSLNNDPGVTLDDILDYESWDLAGEVTTLVAIGVAVALVRSLTERQTDRITGSGVWAGTVSAPAG